MRHAWISMQYTETVTNPENWGETNIPNTTQKESE
jgi:hypothetical protein